MNRMSEVTAPRLNQKISIGLGILTALLFGGSISYSSYFLTTTATDWKNIQEKTIPIAASTLAGTILVFVTLLYFFNDMPPIYLLMVLTAILCLSVGMSYSALLLSMLTKSI
jgi:drug/metabolite transporter (DMT)-like permease